jgi:hypothetical protein
MFAETLSRLRGGVADDKWWKRLLDRVQHAYVAPDFLRKPSLQEWLSAADVQTDFKVLARSRLMPAMEAGRESRQRLRASYSERTGEVKRMCAWMHAGFLARATWDYRIELASFRQWIAQQLTITGDYAEILDLRREPIYRAMEMSGTALRDEVLSRLAVLRLRHEAGGRAMPRRDELDAALSHPGSGRSPFGWAFPGPLDGHHRPVPMLDRRTTDDLAARLAEAVSVDAVGPLLSTLAHLSQRLALEGTCWRVRERP